MSILIVEDNPINAKILEFHLQKIAYQTILAQNGKEALAILGSTPQIQLIIADIMMTEIDGLELLNTIKGHSEWKHIPVIMCSSLADVETVKKAVAAGCQYYIIKPVKKEHLLEKVREALKNEKPVLQEKNEIKSQFGLDEETYQELIRTFASIINNNIDSLEKKLNGKTETGIRLDLTELLECAVYLGAERIQSYLEKWTTKDKKFDEAMEDSEYRFLLNELNILRDALAPSAQNKVSTAKEENEINCPTEQAAK